MYQRLVGSLLYLLRTRPDIAYALGYLTRQLAALRVRHLETALRTLRYAYTTIDMGLRYDNVTIDIEAWSNAS